MGREEGDSTTRRWLLKAAGSAGLSVALAGCSGTDVGTVSTDAGEQTGTPEDGSATDGSGGARNGQTALYGVNPARVTEGETDTAGNLFHDVHHFRTESAVTGTQTNVLSYGHDAGADPVDGEQSGLRSTLTTGVLSTPNADGNPLATESLADLFVSEAGATLRIGIGLGSDVSWVAEPLEVASKEVTALDQDVQLRTFLAVVETGVEPATGGSAIQRPPRVGVATIYASRVPLGSDAVVMGMVDPWNRPPEMTPDPIDVDVETLETIRESFEIAVRTALFERSLGSLGRIGLEPADLPAPPEQRDVSRTLSQDQVGLAKRSQPDLGFSTQTTGSVGNEWSYVTGRDELPPGENAGEDFDAGVQYNYDIETLTTVYPVDGDDTYPVGFVTSPLVELDGEPRNPLASADLASLLEFHGETVLWRLFPDLEIYDNQRSIDWKQGPTSVNARTGVTVWGGDAEFEVFEGTMSQTFSAGGPDKPVRVTVARWTYEDAVMVAMSVNVKTGNPYWDDQQRAADFVETILDHARLDAVESSKGKEMTLSNLRLVQTVSNTRVVDDGTERHDVDDPDLVAGDHVAPVFDLDCPDGPPEHTVFECDVDNRLRNVASEFDRGTTVDLSKSGVDTASVLHDVAVNDSDDDPVVFELDTDHRSVTLHAKAPSGHEYDAQQVNEGTGYGIASVDPLRVGFVTVDDPQNGANYGDSSGTAANYDDSVAVAVEYLRRAFPGSLYAYRHDTSIAGWRRHFGGGEFRDFMDAQTALESAAQEQSFPSNGRVWAFGGARSDAVTAMSNDGFDVWVLIAPEDYYDHHGQSAIGLAPYKKTLAVSVLEAKGGLSQEQCASVAAQEVAHRFANEPYDVAPNDDYPFAQRDDSGTDRDISGGLNGEVDLDHARYEDSDEDERDGVDSPGVVSEAFDLTGGQFRQLDDFGISPGVLSGKVDSDEQVTSLESFMSYQDDDVEWSDAVIHQQLVDSGWTGVRLDQNLFSGIGYVGESGEVTFDTVRAVPGKAFEERDDDGDVRVEMLAPDGEVVVSRTVSRENERHHDGDSDGLVVVQFPFPETATELRTHHDGATVTLNPVTRVLGDALERLPDRALEGDPDDLRSRLRGYLGEIESLMRDQRYDAARDSLQYLTDSVALSVRYEYDRYANQPDVERLLELFERTDNRLEALKEYGTVDT